MFKKWLVVFVGVVVGLFLLPYSLPLVFALVSAFLLEGIVQWFIKVIRFSRIQSVITVFIGYVLVLSFIGYATIAIIATQTVTLSENAPAFIKELYRSVFLPLIEKWKFFSKDLPKEMILSIDNTLERSINSLEAFFQGLVQAIINFLTIVPGLLIEFLIYLVALFLISLELPKLKAKLEEYLSEQTKKKLFLVTSQLNKAGIGFIKAQIILSLMTFTMAMVGLTVLDVPYTALLSLLIVVVDILPILGTGSVLVPWAVIAILQDNQFLGIGLIVLFLVITVVRRIIEPKVYSSSLGISPLAALISLYIGYKIMGLAGVFLGPVMVIIYETLRKANIIKINFKL